MSPKQFKELREKFELNQEEMAKCLGVTAKAISHYETGFRSPGATIRIVLLTLDRLPVLQTKKILELMRELSSSVKSNNSRKSR